MPAPLEILKTYWGYDSFRPLQADIVQAVLDGCDTLALLPTGGGKSICFQVPALCKEGICVVVSPLIALMKDQVQNLRRRGIAAEAVYSGMHYRDIDRILDNCVYGQIKFLYLSPERLGSTLAQERLKRMPVNLLAIDEAHCISQWGYDFRPPYLQIASIRERLPPDVPAIALTATATGPVVKDIQEKLAFRKNSRVFQKSFARDNLAYAVLHEEAKLPKMAEILRSVKGSAVVYVRNRRKCKEAALYLQGKGISADFYHAGLDHEQRSQKQDAWISGRIRAMVATNAFGMGIDKPDVRSVVHLDLPDNLENYFQEAGRAGRDGLKAYAVLLYNANDAAQLRRQYEQSFPPIAEVKRLYQALANRYQLAVGSGAGEAFDFDLLDFAKTYGFDPALAHHALGILAQSGWISLSEAVFEPSRIKVLVRPDELYDFRLKNPGYDALLNILLRKTQGAFSDLVFVNEYQLAGFLQCPVERIRKAFEGLQREGQIQYLPQKDLPQISFLLPRSAQDNLSIDTKLYQFRKERHEARIRAAITYAERPQCRSQQLLAYFGEDKAPACGKCDVCTGRTRAQPSAHEAIAWQRQIEQLLREEARPLLALCQAFPPADKPKLLSFLDHLLQEGLVQETQGQLHWRG